jgi:hypothetical protein
MADPILLVGDDQFPAAVRSPADGQKGNEATFAAGLQDLANRTTYLDNRLLFKAEVRVATDGNITLSGTQTVDGVNVVAGDRVLVKNQTDGAQNGIYVAASGSWARATDWDSSDDVWGSAIVPVLEGTQLGLWQLTTPTPVTLGTTALNFDIVGSGGGAGVSASSTLKDPVHLCATASITLSGTGQTIDGVVVTTGMRILAPLQTLSATRGIYVAAGGAWARSADFDASADVESGCHGLVLQGTLNRGATWVLRTLAPITLGTTGLEFSVSQFLETTEDDAGQFLAVGVDGRVALVDPPEGGEGGTLELVDASGASLPLEEQAYSSGSIEFRRLNDRNVAVRRGVRNVLDYGGRPSDQHTRLSSLASGSASATLLGAADFVNGDHVMVVGAGAAHGLSAPGAPTVTVVGTPGTTQREYAIVWLTEGFGWTAASTVTSISDGPDTFTEFNWCRVRPSGTIPPAAYIGIVYHRAGGSGNWEVAGGFCANSFQFGLTVQFNDKGYRPSGVSQFTFPATSLPASPVNDALKTRIIAGAGTTSVTFAHVSQAAGTLTTGRVDHDNTVPIQQALADAAASRDTVEIPEGLWRIWGNVVLNTSGVKLDGVGIDVTTLDFGMGYGLLVDNGGSYTKVRDLTIRHVTQTLPAGGKMISPFATEAGTVDGSFHGAGLAVRATNVVVAQVRVANVYGSGIYVRGASGEATNANRVKIERVNITTCQGHGIVFSGGDGNAGYILGADVVNCAGDGYLDASFLGNTWIGCHVSGCLGRAYVSRDEGTCFAVFIGCYAEAGLNRPVMVKRPTVWVGGDVGASFDMANSTGLILANTELVTPHLVKFGADGPIWAPNVAKRARKDYVLPTGPNENGFAYLAVATTTEFAADRRTGLTEPTWPTTVGATVQDNDVTWQCVADKPVRSVRVGDWVTAGQDQIERWQVAGAPKGLNHTKIYLRSGGYIHYSFGGNGLNGEAYRWNGFGAGTPRRGVGMLHFPSFIMTGPNSTQQRRFGWSWGQPTFPGPYSNGCTFVDMSGTGYKYTAKTDFCLGAVTWAPNTAYVMGAVVVPTTPDGFAYVNRRVVTTANTGISGSSEPTWAAGVITDGTCEWVRHGVTTATWEIEGRRFVQNASLNFPNCTAGAVVTASVTVTGAAVGDVASVAFRSQMPTGLIITGPPVVTTNTVTFQAFNATGSDIDADAINIDVDCGKH